MSEKEKKAVDKVNKFVDVITVILPKYSTKIPEYCISEDDWISIKILLNLIEKQQKELQQKEEIIKTSIIPSYEETIMENEKQLFEMQEELKEAVHKERILAETQTNYEWEQIIKDKIQEYKNKIEKLENKKIWDEPNDTIRYDTLLKYCIPLEELLRRSKNERRELLKEISEGNIKERNKI